ncbi:hypothetical protein CARUB_v10003656mg [Capsella rubella]|uniref:Uncharacterized protein n=1 Tax=Capsella rubella TaxID=81985 RepID=R0FKB5_9BRAS|nr:hypothetical protein CARUB_v10003656mg [Capsella rubella]
MVDSRLISSEPFSVLYYDLYSESIRRVEVEGIADDEFRRVHGIEIYRHRFMISSNKFGTESSIYGTKLCLKPKSRVAT